MSGGQRFPLATTQGGWLPRYLQVKDGAIVHRQGGEVVPTPTEEAVFAVLHRPYIPPEERR